MIPLPQSQITKIEPLIEAFIDEGNCRSRTTAKHCLERIAQGYLCRTMDAYVDSVESPRRVAVFGRYPSVALQEDLIVVHFVYAVPEDRTKPEMLAAFRELFTRYAQVHPADAMVGSSWVYGGRRGIDAFWRHLGFERQEVVFVKRLKEVNHE